MTTSADFLRELERVADSDGLYSGQFVKEALAAERRATVERIRERVEELGEWYHQDNHITVRWIDISAILDEVAK